uniref:superoxide dismutase n=1 Tax=Athene cunicularia TaxID=194338 RepID=A0A663MPI9_ATHCN
VSFTEAEVQSACGVWEKMLDMDAEDNGTTMIFTDHPDTKTYFTHFKDMDSTKEKKQSDQVAGHSKMVFTAINNMGQHLDNSNAFLGTVNPVGKTHATDLKTDPRNFRIICVIIFKLMKEKFGRDCKASFDKVASEICAHLNNVYKEVG